MVRWRYKLDVKEKWAMAQDNKITAQELAKHVGLKLTELKTRHPNLEHDVQLDELIMNFEDISGDEDLDVDEFDYHWENLYDWADRERCWVATF